jgi:two-component system, OmpR family, KDP operon response regulator KdpE
MLSTSERLHENQAQPIDVYDDGNLHIEHDNYFVSWRGEQVFLSRKEFLIISRLVRNAGRIVAYRSIWQYAWGEETGFNSGALRVHVNHLRQKLGKYGLRIESMVNVGYCLMLPPEAD